MDQARRTEIARRRADALKKVKDFKRREDASAKAKSRLAQYRQDVLPVLQRKELIPPFDPEHMLALGMWISELGAAFSMPFEGHIHSTFDMKGYSNAVLDHGNISIVWQTLVAAQKRLTGFLEWIQKQGFTKQGSGSLQILSRIELDPERTPQLQQVRFWEAMTESSEFDYSVALQLLKDWEGQWAPGSYNLTWVKRSKFWKKLERCSERMTRLSRAVNWSSEYEQEWLRLEEEMILKTMPEHGAIHIQDCGIRVTLGAAPKLSNGLESGLQMQQCDEIMLLEDESMWLAEEVTRLQAVKERGEREKTSLLANQTRLEATVITMSDLLVKEKEAAAADFLKLKGEKSEIETAAAAERLMFRSEEAQMAVERLIFDRQRARYEERQQELALEVSRQKERVEASKVLLRRFERDQTTIAARAKEEALCCKICMGRVRNVVLLPCSHAVYCAKCLEEGLKQMKNCHICRGPIKGYVPMYIA